MNSFDHYDFENFILDESFREFVEGSNQKSADFWNTWILEPPRKACCS